jgi:hypothetical protein
MMNRKWMIPTLALMVLAIAGFPAATVLAGSAPAGGQTLAMMGGGMMGGQGYGSGGYGGGMMGSQGYGGRMGGGYGWSPGGNHSPQAYGDTHLQEERSELKLELRQERQELSEMVRSGNADQARLDRKMDRIESLEQQLDNLR